jgi:nucleoid-associated protein YgaU
MNLHELALFGMRRLLTLPPIMMGRETKILLALLGTLSSGFVGVLGSKLFVPRPPDGAGPDVHLPAGDHDGGPIVDPPSFDRLERSTFSATDLPGDVAAASDSSYETSAATAMVAADGEADNLLEPPTFWQPDSDPGGTEAGGGEHAVAADGLGDPAVGFSRSRPFGVAEVDSADIDADRGYSAAAETADPAFTGANGDVGSADFRTFQAGDSFPHAGGDQNLTAHAGDRFSRSPDAGLPMEPPGRFTPPTDAVPISSGSHLVTAGDTWWSIAERAYGDGRLYKPLFAWNRAIDPRVTLTPGTRLEVPPFDDLATAHGSLLPKDTALAAGSSGGTVEQTSAIESVTPAGPAAEMVVVREGDTLISIARDQLGDSSRWRELYEANRETLGRSPGPLTPGTQLVLP